MQTPLHKASNSCFIRLQNSFVPLSMDSNRNYPEMHSHGNDEEGDWALAMKLATASVFPMVLKAAVELDLFQIIASHGPGSKLSAAEIAAHLHVQNPAAPALLQRIMRLLASYSLLTCSTRALADGRDGAAETVYGLAPVCRFFVADGDGVSLASTIALMEDRVSYDTWHYLKDAVIEGCVPFKKAHGRAAYEYMSVDTRFEGVFDKSMKDHATLVLTEMLQAYKGFESFKSVVNVGGGTGASLNRIITKYPRINGINFDLPALVSSAPEYPGVKHVGGDMFVSVPSAEAILIMGVLPDWSDDRCFDLLKNCYKALPEDGVVIIVEQILPDEVDTDAAHQSIFHFDLIEAGFNVGKLRTAGELETLAKGAGFAGFRPACAVRNHHVIECYKNI